MRTGEVGGRLGEATIRLCLSLQVNIFCDLVLLYVDTEAPSYRSAKYEEVRAGHLGSTPCGTVADP